ncbi:hypothetical protein QTN47_21040 [Danxiaibacter flavus]|uniref:Uncharacterized protein n=1 Tax=Danxiaibacter flavus TaxID=3049108 RepID=A0ABV3ZJJ6_9BACT|nr:hypothetical protein QNM32_21045 [Chitinophagaceae bacterium DXS]
MNKSNSTNISPSLHLPLIDECQRLFDAVDFGVAILEPQRDRTGDITDLVFGMLTSPLKGTLD